jgi:hypothetical protein
VCEHRLHQILEPFMLRRQVEDVESKLPPKVPVVVKVAMSPYQSTIYSWIKASGGWRAREGQGGVCCVCACVCGWVGVVGGAAAGRGLLRLKAGQAASL